MSKMSTMMHYIAVTPTPYQQNSRIATIMSHSLNSSSLLWQNNPKSMIYEHQTNDCQLKIRRQLHNSIKVAAAANDVHVTLETASSSNNNKSTTTTSNNKNNSSSGSSCSQGIPLDNNDEEDEEEQEEMFVTADPVLGHGTIKEWGGPRRGGSLAEPTRFGDWERKGRCTDF